MSTIKEGTRLRTISGEEAFTVTGPGSTVYTVAGCFDHGETRDDMDPSYLERVTMNASQLFTPGDRVFIIGGSKGDADPELSKATVVFSPRILRGHKGCVSVLLDGEQIVMPVHRSRLCHI